MNGTRYAGRIASVPNGEDFAFVGIGTVTTEAGSPHGLDTTKDIFLHRDDANDDLEVGKEVVFNVVPDGKRGDKAFRAVGAVVYAKAELIPAGEVAVPGFASAVVESVPKNWVVAPTNRIAAHVGMKPVPPATVSRVVENKPIPNVSRITQIPQDEETKRQALQWLLSKLCPTVQHFGATYDILSEDDAMLDSEVEETTAHYTTMGLKQEIGVLNDDICLFKDTRSILRLMYEDNLVRTDTVISIKYLPDLFMAVPVWYFWVNDSDQRRFGVDWNSNDPQPSEVVKHFCSLFANQRWCDTFQLFNRRVRTLSQYKGELIPPVVARRMRKAVELFDYVVIATPYHDQAGKDWEDIDWLRAIDPYVLGFKKGIPFIFVLARFSDAGTFPLFNELLGDTIEFLKSQKMKLIGFNQVYNPYWVNAGRSSSNTGGSNLGNYLIGHVNALLAAFEAGNLFDWLRGQEVGLPAVR